MTGRRRLDLVLFVLWLALMVVAVTLAWPVLVVAFFAFAAGERWSSFWTRGLSR